MRIHVGTSGYNYPEWKGTFYPADLPAKKFFGFYSERFRAVEINYTFYRMPTEALAEGWKAQAPPGFLYSLKSPKRITHEKRLRDCADAVTMFSTAVRALGEHVAPVLFQLPPNFRMDLPRLQDFLAILPPDLKAAFEFRHDSWLNDEVYAALASHGVALCIADFGDHTTPTITTARHIYFRLRDEGYTPDDLARWADRLAERQADWDDAFVFFKHEDEGKGPEFARIFIDALPARGLTLA